MYFLLSLVGIAAGIYCIVMKTVWWVTLIAFGSAVICLLAGFYKIGDAMEKEAPEGENEAKNKQVKYPPLVEHCLSMAKSELLEYAKKQAFALRVSEIKLALSNTNSFAYFSLCVVYYGAKDMTPMERDFCIALDLNHAACNDLAKDYKAIQQGLDLVPQLPREEQDMIFALAAAAVVAGGIEPYHLANYKKLLKRKKK